MGFNMHLHLVRGKNFHFLDPRIWGFNILVNIFDKQNSNVSIKSTQNPLQNKVSYFECK